MLDVNQFATKWAMVEPASKHSHLLLCGLQLQPYVLCSCITLINLLLNVPTKNLLQNTATYCYMGFNYSHVCYAVALHPIIEAILTARVNTVNSEIFARVLFREALHMRRFVKIKSSRN